MSEAPELQTSLAPSACEQLVLVLVLVLQPVPASQPPRKQLGQRLLHRMLDCGSAARVNVCHGTEGATTSG